MRGLCAVMVALLHFDAVLGTGLLARHGWLSVDMFFVLSGFVIALKYEDRLQSRNSFGAFVGTRAARLLPVQFLGTMVTTLALSLVYLTGHQNDSGVTPVTMTIAFLYGVFLIPISLSPVAGAFGGWQSPFPVNPPLWSLQGEWLVNIVYGRWLSSARTWLLILFWAGLTLYLVNHVFTGRRTWDLAKVFELIPCMARAGIGFLAGVVLYRALRQGFLARLPSISPGIVFGIWFLICLVPDTDRTPVFESAAAVIVAPLCVALLIRGERPLPKLCGVLGALSYPFYASHCAIVYLAVVWRPPGTMHLLFLIPMLLAALLLAYGIERSVAALQSRTRRVLHSLRICQPSNL